MGFSRSVLVRVQCEFSAGASSGGVGVQWEFSWEFKCERRVVVGVRELEEELHPTQLLRVLAAPPESPQSRPAADRRVCR